MRDNKQASFPRELGKIKKERKNERLASAVVDRAREKKGRQET